MMHVQIFLHNVLLPAALFLLIVAVLFAEAYLITQA